MIMRSSYTLLVTYIDLFLGVYCYIKYYSLLYHYCALSPLLLHVGCVLFQLSCCHFPGYLANGSVTEKQH